MSRLLVRCGVFRRGPFRGGLGDAETAAPAIPSPTDSQVLVALDLRTQEILKRIDEDAKARRYALYIGAASALFAAAKLGIIALPAIKSRVRGT